MRWARDPLRVFTVCREAALDRRFSCIALASSGFDQVCFLGIFDLTMGVSPLLMVGLWLISSVFVAV